MTRKRNKTSPQVTDEARGKASPMNGSPTTNHGRRRVQASEVNGSPHINGFITTSQNGSAKKGLAKKSSTKNGSVPAVNGSPGGDVDPVETPPVSFSGKVYKGLVSHSYLPSFLADNEFLLNYHRPQLNSFIECFRSIFSLHTETGNIWTHLGGAVLFVLISIYYLFHSVSWGQRCTFFIFFFGAITCLGCSGVYHTVLCHSEPIYRLFSKLDYCGVILLIVTSWAPWLHFGFYCSMASKLAYTVLMGSLGTTCIVVILYDGFSGKEYRPLRAGLFVALGLTGVLPGIHYSFVYGVAGQLHMFIWLILMAVIYILGAIIYAMRIPERFLPGTFDIWFQSHQIMHVCVVIAALFCYHGASLLADYRINQQLDCVQSIPGAAQLVDLETMETVGQ